jgi:PncC family amidohydrolase
VTLLTAAAHEEEARARVDAVAAKVTARLGRVSGRDGETLEETVGELLRRRTWKVAVAESCTGGRLAARLAAVAGASDYLERAFVTYSNRAKQELLGVPEALLEVHGAVSEEVAAAMAQGARARAPVDVTLAVTGIAGPTGATPGKPVGTVFVACATRDELAVERHQLFGDRLAIQEKSVHAALVLLWKRLLP